MVDSAARANTKEAAALKRDRPPNRIVKLGHARAGTIAPASVSDALSAKVTSRTAAPFAPIIDGIEPAEAEHERRRHEDETDRAVDDVEPVRQHADDAGLVVGQEGQREGRDPGRDRQPQRDRIGLAETQDKGCRHQADRDGIVQIGVDGLGDETKAHDILLFMINRHGRRRGRGDWWRAGSASVAAHVRSGGLARLADQACRYMLAWRLRMPSDRTAKDRCRADNGRDEGAAHEDFGATTGRRTRRHGLTEHNQQLVQPRRSPVRVSSPCPVRRALRSRPSPADAP